MPENLHQSMWGEGVAFIGGKEGYDVQNLMINLGLESISFRKGDAGGNAVVNTGQPITGRLEFKGINAALLATLTGGSSATGTRTRIREEALTVATDAVTASQTPIANTMRVVEQGSNNVPLKQVAASPETDEYTVSGTTITFNASAFEDGIIIMVSYFYVAGAAGETVTIDPTDLPGSFELQGSVRTKEHFADTKSDIIFYAAKCVRTSEIPLGGPVGDFGGIGFDFNIELDNSGDFLVYFP